ncbi:hypothetical protein [Qipengyuania flava]|uniref:hypothetical protein n=1 Tax=Qipengyuania flava TaxID=192812 RepID=UPI001C5A2F0A|nr:hypothetical protein [Qipengyuania flava]MBW3168804.1 hypothetical protein [Qipengyuania flava]MBY5966042.1 hypothetical protein [Qipengyuania flava]MBY6012366.1 hypothetical protein [Qipengyuania flava]MBY6026808.1 hypothetical protein [Qipengyuania flava]
MLWFLIFFLVVAGAVAVAIGKARGAGVAVQAEYERIKRTEPDSALAQYGPNEFEMAWKRAIDARKRASNIAALKVLPLMAAILFAGFAIPLLVLNDDGTLLVLGSLIAGGVALWYMKTKVLDPLPSILDFMKRDAG